MISWVMITEPLVLKLMLYYLFFTLLHHQSISCQIVVTPTTLNLNFLCFNSTFATFQLCRDLFTAFWLKVGVQTFYNDVSLVRPQEGRTPEIAHFGNGESKTNTNNPRRIGTQT